MAEQVTLPASPTSASRGRSFLSAYGRSHAVPDEVVDDAVLLVSELVGNAFVHAGSGTRICVDYRGQVLHVEVADDSPALPVLRPASTVATGGRGVLILDAVASRWGVRRVPSGKIVWFDVPR